MIMNAAYAVMHYITVDILSQGHTCVMTCTSVRLKMLKTFLKCAQQCTMRADNYFTPAMRESILGSMGDPGSIMEPGSEAH